MDDRLLDLIVECQGRRMDDQRSSAVPPVEGVEAAKVLDRRSVAGEGSPRAPEEGERAQAVRQRQPVRVDEGRRRVSNGSLGSLDDLFFDTLMSAQVSVSGACVCVCACMCMCGSWGDDNLHTGGLLMCVTAV